MSLNLDLKQLTARIFFGLKSFYTNEDFLSPRYLEVAACTSFGCQHVGDSAFFADGINGPIQISVKTRKLQPHLLKQKEGRDFQSHQEKFLGPQINQKHNKWTNGLEIVQRRQKLNLENDSTADPSQVGEETLNGFLENIEESSKRYNTTDTYEVILVHGYNIKGEYIVSLFWKKYEFLDPKKINWIREGYGVSGYIQDNNNWKKICERINGNAKREATCFKEYKDLTKYDHSAKIILPLPNPWEYNQEDLLEEIDQKRNSNEPILLRK